MELCDNCEPMSLHTDWTHQAAPAAPHPPNTLNPKACMTALHMASWVSASACRLLCTVTCNIPRSDVHSRHTGFQIQGTVSYTACCTKSGGNLQLLCPFIQQCNAAKQDVFAWTSGQAAGYELHHDIILHTKQHD